MMLAAATSGWERPPTATYCLEPKLVKGSILLCIVIVNLMVEVAHSVLLILNEIRLGWISP